MDTTNLPPTPDSTAAQPVTPISGGNKEHAPISTGRSEYMAVSPAETVPHIPQELRELGIEESPDTAQPDVSAAARAAGVQPVKTAVPVSTTPQGIVQIQTGPVPTPFDLQQATVNLKSHKADESITWLSMLSKYILEKIGWQNTGEKG
jgi:hypothetical protein